MTRSELAMVDHATAIVHRAAVGEDKHMHTECGLELESATIGAFYAVRNVMTSATVCAECWPEP